MKQNITLHCYDCYEVADGPLFPNHVTIITHVIYIHIYLLL